MDFQTLTKNIFILYAMGNYTNPDCMGINEFDDDMAKIKYVKRLLKKYVRSGFIRPILLLNHLLILGNVFGIHQTSRMLFFKLEPELHAPLKTVLLYLNYIEDRGYIEGLNIQNIPMDTELATMLRKITNDHQET